MQLQEIESAFITPARSRAIVKAVELAGSQRVEFKGLSGSSAAMALAAIGPLPHPVVIVADTLDDAGYLYQDLSRLLGEQAVAMLPSAYKRDIKYGRVDPPSQIMRIETLNRLGDPADKALRAVVTYPEAIAEKVARKADLSAHTLRLAAGEEINLDDTRKWLLDNGFGQVDYVYEPGHFAIRGSIIDIFGYSSALPYRVDLFGDEIESIRTFNIETQLSERKLDSISVTANVATDSDSAGESLLDFVASDTLLCVRSEQFALGRIDAVCSETFSTSSMLADEGDANALKISSTRSASTPDGRLSRKYISRARKLPTPKFPTNPSHKTPPLLRPQSSSRRAAQPHSTSAALPRDSTTRISTLSRPRSPICSNKVIRSIS